MTLQAIPTPYDGNLFRSRLEARWAVFFNTLGIRYEYEKEGYRLPTWYLPDFWLPEQDCWFEVKPSKPSTREELLTGTLGSQTGKRSFIMPGEVPNPCDMDGITHWSEYHDGAYILSPYWDNHYTWCECPICGLCGLEYEGRAARLPCRCQPDSDKGRNSDSSRLLEAYLLARTQRFEHHLFAGIQRSR